MPKRPAARSARPASQVPARRRAGAGPLADNREAILVAAARLFAEHGVEGVTFADIAAAAGISRTLIYFHFKTRDQLVLETVRTAHERLLAQFRAAVAKHRRGVDQLQEVGRAYHEFSRDEATWFTLLSCHAANPDIHQGDDPVHEEIQRLGQEIFGLMVETIQRGQADGSIRRDVGDPLRLALTLWATTHGLIQVTAAHGKDLQEQFGIGPGDLIGFGLDFLRAGFERGRRRA
jgi:TetR/AcrR family transcriptional regulator